MSRATWMCLLPHRSSSGVPTCSVVCWMNACNCTVVTVICGNIPLPEPGLMRASSVFMQ
ncbi:hypothetical protein ElyMa_000445800, partial [Elysia marginata]